ncbi:MAG: hypothetical protein RL483_1472 [Pseudomonadota bacterium]
MAILTGLPPGARANAGSKGQNGAEAGLEALFAGRALGAEAGNDAANPSVSDPFAAALQAALTRVGAGLEAEQIAVTDAAALAAQGQILPNATAEGLQTQANFAVIAPQAQMQDQITTEAADLTLLASSSQVAAAAPADLIAQQASLDAQALAAASAQDASLLAKSATQATAVTQAVVNPTAAQTLTPEQLAALQAAADQAAAQSSSPDLAATLADPMAEAQLAAALPGTTPVGGQLASPTNQQTTALAALANGPQGAVQTANQQAANDEQGAASNQSTLAGLLSVESQDSSAEAGDDFASLLDNKQLGSVSLAAPANSQSAQLVSQLSANGQANTQALNAAQTPVSNVIDPAQATGESASLQLAARTESRVEALRASLGSGPLNMEVLKLTSAGGGRAVIEVTPPGKASLVVDGLTDSMKARLESSAGFLRQDMAGMGLTLNLELRERNQGQSANMQFSGQFGSNQSGGSGSSRSSNGSAPDSNGFIGPVGRGQSSNSTDNGVNLYA